MVGALSRQPSDVNSPETAGYGFVYPLRVIDGPNADIYSHTAPRNKRLPGRGLPKSTSWSGTPNIGSRAVLLKYGFRDVSVIFMLTATYI